MDIQHWRSEIDEIDRELLRLLNMRARLAIKVGTLKTQPKAWTEYYLPMSHDLKGN